MPRLKTRRDIAGIYRSGQVAGRFLDEVEALVRPGVATSSLDRFAADFIGKNGGVPAFLGYNGFPGNICVSLNQEIVHGIPGPRVIREGDLVSVDVGVKLNGYFSDTARTFWAGPGPIPPDVARLMAGTKTSLKVSLAAVAHGKPLRLVSAAIEQTLEASHLAVIRELTGHGTGSALHEEPTVYNFDPGVRRPLVENGMVLAIEPMAALGGAAILLAADNWTYFTADDSLAAHFEHTVACWEGRAVVLTDPADEAARELFGQAGKLETG